MDREDLILRLLCASAIAERDGFVFFADALANLLQDLISLDPSLPAVATLDEVFMSMASAPQNLTIQ